MNKVSVGDSLIGGSSNLREIILETLRDLNLMAFVDEVRETAKNQGADIKDEHIFATLVERLRREGKSQSAVDIPRFTGATRFIRPSEITSITGLSKGTIYRLEKLGLFPKRVLIGISAVAWDYSAVKSWMESRTSTIKLAVASEVKRGRPRKASVAA